MMPASRNPFYVRTAEQAESDDQFLNLFSLAVLDLLPEDGSWNRFLPIESAPGVESQHSCDSLHRLY